MTRIDRFDLDGGFLVFTPGADGGYDLRPVPDVVAPICTVTTPVNGSMLFEGEVLSIDANATDNASVSRVTLQSTEGDLVDGGAHAALQRAVRRAGWRDRDHVQRHRV